MNKIITIGGPPMIGKTTLALEIASTNKYCCMSTDDIGEALRAGIKTASINPMQGSMLIPPGDIRLYLRDGLCILKN